ncbi:10065_t:CDS:2, partial [Acaulospora colombiana]
MSLFTNLVPTPLKTLEKPTDTPHAALDSISTVGSHSWMEIDGKPTLAIPGKLPFLVTDKGTQYIDHNGAKCEEADAHRLAPVIQSVEQCSPNFDFKNVNLICNRNNIRNLLRWLEGTLKKDFRIDMHLVNDGKTIVMQEYELKCTEDIDPIVQFRGFGDNFRARKLGQFNVLMAHKVEGYVTRHQVIKDDLEDELDSLTSALNTVRLTGASSTGTIPTSSEGARVNVQQTSDGFREYGFVEIKTMSGWKEIDWKEWYPQLYLSQTKYLYVARHTRGTFDKMEKFKVTDPEVEKIYKEKMEDSLGRLLEFLRRLFAAAKRSGNGPWALLGIQHDEGDLILPTITSWISPMVTRTVKDKTDKQARRKGASKAAGKLRNRKRPKVPTPGSDLLEPWQQRLKAETRENDKWDLKEIFWTEEDKFQV